MSLGPGSRLGSYEITAKLGEGGMGEVYRATDTKLRREVAIKVLPAAFTEDKERLARFEREAQLLAQLHHPNIASIFGMEESDGTRALVMELVEGPTLAERLEAGPFSFNECLSVSVQIAHALEEAHEKGIVHRDLKPQNIKASIEGKTKVLDFGLAKAMDPHAGASGASSAATMAKSPTLTIGATQMGMILGTAAYMSPEQAKGMAIDKRSDIWAFGVVLYEMLVGGSLFAGDSVGDTLAAVIRAEIDFSRLPADTPVAVRQLLRRCLERNPKNRLHDIADARIALEELLAGRVDEPAAGLAAAQMPVNRRRRWLGFAAVALGGIAIGWGIASLRSGRDSAAAAVAAPRPTFRQLTKVPGGERSPTISPDGESFVFVKQDGDDLDLFTQRIDGAKAIALTAECDRDDLDPAFSPDGRWIAYRSECGGGIFVMGATGESGRRVTDFGYTPAWSPDGRELAVVTEQLDGPTSRSSVSELWAVNVESGVRRKVSDHDAMSPNWSPDGKRIAFWGLKGDGFQRDLWSVAADGSESAADAAFALLDDPAIDWAPVYSRDGRWLWFASTRGGTFNLWRLALDPATGKPRGEPEPLTAPSSWAGPFALSADGRRVVFVDQNIETEVVRAPLGPSRRELAAPPVHLFSGSFELREQVLSPDGEWVLFTNENPPQQLHLVRADGTAYRQLTNDSDRNRQGAWSPKGDWIVFQTTRGESSLAAIRPDGGGWQSLPAGLGLSTPAWSPDGSTLSAFDSVKGGVLFDVRGGLGAAVGKPLPPISPEVLFWPSAWSPDGSLLAGMASRAGQIESIALYSLSSGTYRIQPWAIDSHEWISLTFLDRERIVYSNALALWLGDLGSGETKRLVSAAPGHRLVNATSSADGRSLTWIDRADESDIWLMTLEEPAGDAKTSVGGTQP